MAFPLSLLPLVDQTAAKLPALARAKRRRRAAMPRPLEKDVQKQIIAWLTLNKFFVVRINSGSMAGEYKGKKRFIRFTSQPGCSDLLAVSPAGVFTAVECKRPGGKATPEQLSFLESVRKHGGIGIVADSVESLERQLGEIS